MSSNIKVEEGSGNVFKDLVLMKSRRKNSKSAVRIRDLPHSDFTINRDIEIRIIPSENREGQRAVAV